MCRAADTKSPRDPACYIQIGYQLDSVAVEFVPGRVIGSRSRRPISNSKHLLDVFFFLYISLQFRRLLAAILSPVTELLGVGCWFLSRSRLFPKNVARLRAAGSASGSSPRRKRLSKERPVPRGKVAPRCSVIVAPIIASKCGDLCALLITARNPRRPSQVFCLANWRWQRLSPARLLVKAKYAIARIGARYCNGATDVLSKFLTSRRIKPCGETWSNKCRQY